MIKRRLASNCLSVSFSISSLMLSFTLSWLVLASANFLYPIWHDVGGVGAGIDKFGPKNRYKPGFGDTSPSQRADLFAQINTAVHKQGLGLAEIRYESDTSKGEQLLLREPEVVHLQDVANLIDVLKLVVALNFGIWCALAIVIYKFPRPLLSWVSQLGGVGAGIAFSTVVVLMIGPVRVFNQLHIWVFPKDHEWFFYYQDSLMSTLMLAPTLFGWIAAALLALAIVFFGCLIPCCVKLERTLKQSKSK